jgi:hypothetical protein
MCGDDAVADADGPIPVAERRVVFISNVERRVAMANQRAGQGDLVMWDYHVVLVARRLVWDLDCLLGAPLPLARWLATSFVRGIGPPPRFRVIDAPAFLETFASDRSHMAASEHPPPPWPPIGHGMTLERFVDMRVGETLDATALAARLG